MNETYCKLFVDTNLNGGQLVALLGQISGGSVDSRTVISADCELDVMRNEEFDSTKAAGPDGFLFYRYYLDVFPRTDAGERYKRCIAALLEGLWHSGCKAVAACRFESELPRRGGLANPG